MKTVTHRLTWLSLAVVFVLVVGCTAVPAPTQTAVPSPTAATGAAPTATTALASPEPTNPAPLVLHLWLPPEFDPRGEGAAAALLQARLDEFEARRSNLQIEVRIKALDGPGGMINSLTTASAAAPLALPDLVAFNRITLEAAVLKGLLYPLDAYVDLDDPDWFDYAAALGRLQGSSFGLPFAGDALVLLYRPMLINPPPTNWETLLQLPAPLLFAAGGEQGLFTLVQYESAGGLTQDDAGRPLLQAESLGNVLRFYEQGVASDQLPFWLTQYETDQQVWEAFVQERSALAVTWLSRYLAQRPAGVAPALLPAASEPLSLADGWFWSLSNPDPARQALAAELAQFLSLSDFSASWTQAAGFLPARQSALELWQEPELAALLGQVVATARPYPATDLLTSLGPALQEATIQVLKQQLEAAAAAEQAAGRVNAP